jgi:hypothetical protein
VTSTPGTCWCSGGADVERVAGVYAWAQQELPKAPASVPGSPVFGRSEWAIGVELCERARGMIQEAGAERDPFARRRLLAGVDSALTAETLGVFPGRAEDAGQRLIQELGDIDADERRAGA